MVMVTCTMCGGSGQVMQGMVRVTCPQCGGRGQIDDGRKP